MGPQNKRGTLWEFDWRVLKNWTRGSRGWVVKELGQLPGEIRPYRLVVAKSPMSRVASSRTDVPDLRSSAPEKGETLVHQVGIGSNGLPQNCFGIVK